MTARKNAPNKTEGTTTPSERTEPTSKAERRRPQFGPLTNSILRAHIAAADLVDDEGRHIEIVIDPPKPIEVGLSEADTGHMSLPQIGSDIRADEAKSIDEANLKLARAIRQGIRLNRAKELLMGTAGKAAEHDYHGRGRWGRWCADHAKLNTRVRERYMRIARHQDFVLRLAERTAQPKNVPGDDFHPAHVEFGVALGINEAERVVSLLEKQLRDLKKHDIEPTSEERRKIEDRLLEDVRRNKDIKELKEYIKYLEEDRRGGRGGGGKRLEQWYTSAARQVLALTRGPHFDNPEMMREIELANTTNEKEREKLLRASFTRLDDAWNEAYRAVRKEFMKRRFNELELEAVKQGLTLGQNFEGGKRIRRSRR